MTPPTIRDAINHSIDQYYACSDADEAVTNLYALFVGEAEAAVIANIMQRCRHNQSEAAKILGITRNTLKRKLDRHHIPYPTAKQKR